MKIPFKYKGVHACDAVVLACIDFRYWWEIAEFIRNKEEGLGIFPFDFPKLPGAAKAVNESSDGDITELCTDVPCALHHAKKIIIVNHEDCGAYGGSSKFQNSQEEQNFHEGELKKAKSKLMEKYPDKEIILVYARLVDDQNNIEFVIIK